jgi:hypothetical protein
MAEAARIDHFCAENRLKLKPAGRIKSDKTNAEFYRLLTLSSINMEKTKSYTFLSTFPRNFSLYQKRQVNSRRVGLAPSQLAA